MKYIRTTKGIWEIEKLTKQDYEWLQKGENKQADSIEELCDEFVFLTNKRKFINKMDFKRIELLLGTEEKLLKTYGAIWTDKGLIYIAKMNDEGELELL